MTTATMGTFSAALAVSFSQNMLQYGASSGSYAVRDADLAGLGDYYTLFGALEPHGSAASNAMITLKPSLRTHKSGFMARRPPTTQKLVLSRHQHDENRNPTPSDRPIAPLPRPKHAKMACASPAMEDWTEDYVFEDEVNPFSLPNVEQWSSPSDSDPHSDAPSHSSVDEEGDLAMQIDEQTTATSSSLPSSLPLYPCASPEAKANEASSHPRGWMPPGPSPLSPHRANVAPAAVDIDLEYLSLEFASSVDLDDDDDAPSLYFQARHPPQASSTKTRPVSRSLSGRAHGNRRVSPSLRLSLSKARLLRHVAGLGVEDPVLDALDERTIEFLFDAQASLATPSTSLAAFARVPGEPPVVGTVARRTKWGAQKRMPWRVMDYGKAAERMLERQRASARLLALRRG